MSKRRFILLAGVSIIVIGSFILLPKVLLFSKSRKTTINQTEKAVYLSESTGLEGLANILFEQEIIDDIDAFMAVGDYKGLNEESIALGKYIISPRVQYRNVLNGFKLNAAGNGNAEVEVEVTFNKCRDLKELASKATRQIYIDSATLINYLEEKEVMDKYGFSAEEFPTMFLPNTYRMYYDTDEKVFVEKMAQEFKNYWNPDRKEKLKNIGLKSPSQAVTLASIVYGEQDRFPDEWPTIAGLYLNRIQQGIRLQSDPTFKFCWGDKLKGVQRLLFEHRDIDCPYNTYKIDGLPPGPINLPPSQVVDAVLNAEKHNYIYMMAKADYSGRHNFAKEYATHLNFARKYQKWLANELKKQN